MLEIIICLLFFILIVGIGALFQMQALITLLQTIQAQLTAFIASVGTPAQIQQATTIAQGLSDALTQAGAPPPPAAPAS